MQPDGRPNFCRRLFRRDRPHCIALDILACEGEDLTPLPLTVRKRHLRRVLRPEGARVLVLEGIERRGRDLFRAAYERDLQGIVGTWCSGSYCTDGRSTSWVKIKNPAYSQMGGRHELFAPSEAERVR